MNKLPVLTEDEWETVYAVFHDWGLIDSYFVADYNEVEALKKKLQDYSTGIID